MELRGRNSGEDLPAAAVCGFLLIGWAVSCPLMCSGGHGRRPGSSAMVLCSLSFSVDGLPPSAVAASLIGREKGRRRRSWSAWFPLARGQAAVVAGMDAL